MCYMLRDQVLGNMTSQVAPMMAALLPRICTEDVGNMGTVEGGVQQGETLL